MELLDLPSGSADDSQWSGVDTVQQPRVKAAPGIITPQSWSALQERAIRETLAHHCQSLRRARGTSGG